MACTTRQAPTPRYLQGELVGALRTPPTRGDDVTTTTGIKVAAGATFGPVEVGISEHLYAICADGAAAIVNVLETDN